MTRDNQEDIVRICTLVSGIPLAIELAAAWIRLLSCCEIAREIEKNLDFLSSEHRDIPERHRSIRVTFEYSWNLMSEVEQDVFRKLSVFQGGFTREAAKEVTGTSLQILASLIDRSMLYRTFNGRFHILEILRQSGEDKLKLDPVIHDEMIHRHCRFYADYADGLRQYLDKKQRQDFIAGFSRERDNIHSAWFHATRAGEFSEITKVLTILYNFYTFTALYAEGDILLQHGLDNIMKKVHPILEASVDIKEIVLHAIDLRADILRIMGESEVARKLLQQARTICSSIGKGIMEEARILQMTGLIEMEHNHYKEAKPVLEESLAIFEKLGNPESRFSSILNLANVNFYLGDRQTSRSLFDLAIHLARESGNKENIVKALRQSCLVIEDTRVHRQIVEESLEVIREIGRPDDLFYGLMELGHFERGLGNDQRALALHTEAYEIALKSKSKLFNIMILQEIGQDHLALGNHTQARRILEDALERARSDERYRNIMILSILLSRIEMHDGNYEKAESMIRQGLEISLAKNFVDDVFTNTLSLCQLFISLEKYESAIDAIWNLYQDFRRAGDTGKRAYMLQIMSIICIRKNRLRRAEILIRKSLEIFQKFKSDLKVAECQAALGSIMAIRGLRAQAVECYREVISFSRKTKNLAILKWCLLDLINILAEDPGENLYRMFSMLQILIDDSELSMVQRQILLRIKEQLQIKLDLSRCPPLPEKRPNLAEMLDEIEKML